MLEWITAHLGMQAIQWTAGGIAVFIIGWIFKKIPNHKIKARWGSWMYSLGVKLTLKTSSIGWLKKAWEKVIEAWIIDFIDNVIVTGIQEFVRGLRSDNR